MIPAFMPGVLVAANKLTGGAVGDFVENVVTQVTGSESAGKLAGAVTDAKTGNWASALARGAEFINGLDDFQVEAELRWGPGSAARICGTPGAVAECCPGPSRAPAEGLPERFTVDLSWNMGLVGWGVSFSLGQLDGAEASGAGGASPAVRSILDDPSLSLEAKIALLFAQLIDELDEEIEAKLGDVAADGDDNKAATELQHLMQKRGQMYGMQSNMMSMFHDVSMQVINNVR